jgi:O-antigen ligase
MDREKIDTWLQRAVLVLVLGALVFGPLALGGVRASEFVVLQWLITGALAIWLARIWVAPRFKFFFPPSTWALLPFVIYAIWRYRTADIEYLARQEVMQVFLAAALFLLIVNNLYGQMEIRIISITLIALGTLVAMYGIYQWLTNSQHVWHFFRDGYEGRGSGTYICANHLAGFLEMICPIAISFTLLRGFGALSRIFFAYASFVMLIGIASTRSRGGWLAAAVAVVALALVLIRKRSHVWAALALLLVVGGTGRWLYSKVLEPRIHQSVSSGKADDIRFRLWASAKQMWRDHPWFGVGPDHFDFRYRNYRRAHWELQSRPGRAHNDYWNTLADWGVVGLVLVLVPVAVTGVGAVRSWKHLHRSGEIAGSRAALVLGASAGITALLVHSFFDFNMHIPANAFLAATLLAIISVHWRFASQRYWVTARWPVRLAATLAMTGVGCYLGDQAWRHTLEASALRRVEAAPAVSKERIARLEKAFRIEPRNAETAYAIGEQLRLLSSVGKEDHEQLAMEAIGWFDRAMKLNPWDPYACVRLGMCLDWLGKHSEAEPYFLKALQMDPNHWHTRVMMGWHCFQMDRFPETRQWMEGVLSQLDGNNEMARLYLTLAEKKQAEGNAGRGFMVPLPK